MTTRRGFLASLAALPLVARFLRKPEPTSALAILHEYEAGLGPRYRYTMFYAESGVEQSVVNIGEAVHLIRHVGTRLMLGFDEADAHRIELRRYARQDMSRLYRLESSLPMTEWLSGAKFTKNNQPLSWGQIHPDHFQG